MKKVYLSLFYYLFLFSQQAWAQVIQLERIGFTTSEGIYLESDIYLPDTLQPHPTVLLRTPYGKFQYKKVGLFFAERGYATVIQDVRGKFESSGDFFPFQNERTDGLSTLDWASKQVWSNGDVGMFGVSYPAFCALTLAADQHPALKTIVNISGWVEPADMATDGGALHLLLNLPWLLHEETLTRRDLGDYDLDSLLRYLPIKDALRSVGIESKAWENSGVLDQLNQDYAYEQVDIPILHLCGAFDFVKKGTLKAYQALRARRKKHQKLIFGPWFHNQYLTSLTEVGILECGDSSEMGYDALLEKAAEWFDQYLKEHPGKSAPYPAPEVFFLVANTWQKVPQFLQETNCGESWYIQGVEAANSRFGGGTLLTHSASKAANDQFLFDPYQPVPTNGGANFHFFPAQLGVKDQSELEEREDILVYTSQAFTQTKRVAGNIKLRLFAATDGPDTDFTAKLVLVDKQGIAMNMADGIIRARYRNGRAKEELLVPNRVYEYTIDLGVTAFEIPLDYRLRLEISSSNFPKYDRNSNNEIDAFEAKALRSARQTIYFGPDHPTRLILPFICNQ
ncbi:MAG: CocE/NonD family hydrolase [Saprospiraceae bacterium]|nr:CocE/NonD family hydrolase [Saprospiraceae bacterium]